MGLTVKAVYDIICSIPVNATADEKKSVCENVFGNHIKELSSTYVCKKMDNFLWQYNHKLNDVLIAIKEKKGGNGNNKSLPPKTFFPNAIVGIELKGFQCNICDDRFETKDLLSWHMNIERQRVDRFHAYCLARVWRHPSFKRYLCEPALIPGVIQHKEYRNLVRSLNQTTEIIKEIERKQVCINLLYIKNTKTHTAKENTKLIIRVLSNTQMFKLVHVKTSW